MSDIPPNVRAPTPAEIREIAADHHMQLTDDEVEDYATLIAELMESYEHLDELVEPRPEPQYTDRDTGSRPQPDDNPYNAFITRCEVKGTSDGPLAGYEVGLKDNVAVAGVELTCGSKVLDGYRPATDATVVTRLLDGGATIVGKTAMEDMSYSSSGELCATGPVTNPRDPNYLAGGSSSGSAAAVAAGLVDAALGGDQGGSIRIPAAKCGCVGHKPTFGLVPHTGIVGVEPNIDYTGPIATSAADCARVLEAIAGPDTLDPRCRDVPPDLETNYTDAVSTRAENVVVGVLEEGFGWEDTDPGIEDTVADALDRFEAMATVEAVRDVSVPMHRDGRAIWVGITYEGTAAMFDSDGVGRFLDGFYDTQFAEAFAQARRVRADDFPPTLKPLLVLGQYMSDKYRSHYYAKAQNLRRPLTQAYDEALANVDVLAMPTILNTAHERKSGLSRRELFDRDREGATNTSPFNVTGHPAISVPCGTVSGLPVGLMFVGDRFDDATVLRIAHAFEQAVDWQER